MATPFHVRGDALIFTRAQPGDPVRPGGSALGTTVNVIGSFEIKSPSTLNHIPGLDMKRGRSWFLHLWIAHGALSDGAAHKDRKKLIRGKVARVGQRSQG